MNQLEQVREHLKKFGRITSWQCIQDYHITRLSAHILTLKKQGMKIVGEWETNGEKHWVAYRLVP